MVYFPRHSPNNQSQFSIPDKKSNFLNLSFWVPTTKQKAEVKEKKHLFKKKPFDNALRRITKLAQGISRQASTTRPPQTHSPFPTLNIYGTQKFNQDLQIKKLINQVERIKKTYALRGETLLDPPHENEFRVALNGYPTEKYFNINNGEKLYRPLRHSEECPFVALDVNKVQPVVITEWEQLPKQNFNQFEVLNSIDQGFLPLLDRFEKDGKIYLVQKWCEQGDLIDVCQSDQFCLIQKSNMAIDIFEGIKSLQERGFTPTNLNPENILVDQDGKAFLSEIQSLENIHILNTISPKRTNCYSSPETLFYQTFNDKSIVYNLGLVLYFLYSNDQAESVTRVQAIQKYANENKLSFEIALGMFNDPFRISFPKRTPLDRLIHDMLNPNSQERISFDEAYTKFSNLDALDKQLTLSES